MALDYFCGCWKVESMAFAWGIISTVLSVILAGVDMPYFVMRFYAYSNIYYDRPKFLPTSVDIAYVIYIFCNIAASILLSYGAAKKKHLYMVPWLCLHCIFLLLLSQFAIITFILALPFVFPYYIFWCIHSARVKIEKEGEIHEIAPTTPGMCYSVMPIPNPVTIVPNVPPSCPNYPGLPSTNYPGANRMSDERYSFGNYESPPFKQFQ